MATTETTETLRAAIEAAMRRRDPGVRVSVTPAAGQTLASVDGPSSALVWGSSMADTADEALRRLARGFGLRDDGSDPVAEVERLTRALHDVAERLGCADYDDVVAAVSDALDDAEKREREHVDEANALRTKDRRLTRERYEAQAALTHFAPRCAHGAIATWSARIDEAPTMCDACRRDTSVEHEHAAALRAAGGGR